MSALYSVEDNDEIEFLSNSDECGTTAALASGDPVDSSPDSSVFNGDTSQVFYFVPPHSPLIYSRNFLFDSIYCATTAVTTLKCDCCLSVCLCVCVALRFSGERFSFDFSSSPQLGCDPFPMSAEFGNRTGGVDHDHDDAH